VPVSIYLIGKISDSRFLFFFRKKTDVLKIFFKTEKEGEGKSRKKTHKEKGKIFLWINGLGELGRMAPA